MRLIPFEELKSIQLEMLKEVDRFCKKNNIEYFLACGTLLGAVRHKGFIPWDDDIDICMKRDQYDLFFKIFNNKNSRYKAINIDNEQNYYLQFGKVIDTNTALYENASNAMEIGVFIDVFPLDSLPENKKEIEKFRNSLIVYEQLLVLKNIKINNKRTFTQNMVIVFGKMLSSIYKREKLIKIIDKKSKKYNNDKRAINIGRISIPRYQTKHTVNKKEYSFTVDLQFEGYFFKAPVGYHDVLSAQFGNYMILPEKDKQKPHHSFEAYYKN